MRKTNKKGFTIVELVIVIAVIAILAAVMIPTFAGVIDKANESGALQQATALYKDAYAVAISDGKIDDGTISVATNVNHYYEVQTAGDLYFVFISEDGSINNLTVKVCGEAVASVTGTKSDSTTTYTCKTSSGETADDGKIDDYTVTVTNGVVSVKKG